jgi:hypothetical protein
MFWEAFSDDKKGPCYILEDETKAEKAACKNDLEARNAIREASNHAE